MATADASGYAPAPPRPPCHRCGHRDPAARDGIRYACANLACGWGGHADTNAAINIKNAVGTPVSGRGDLGAARSAKRQPPRAA
ncbi:zinc ribbon domain-containing protein [Streptosporangium amethystogenes]|uniref:zinc ribbon domain-containing protein n=1 Tax=Streptosporangium amethystogenes TaxID=2002 RepID=UPI0037AE46A6